MKTITKEYKVYTFDELSKDAKEKVQNDFGTSDIDIQTDFLKEDFSCLVQEKYPYFENCTFYWSLSCCQGDGLCFKCESIDILKFIELEKIVLKESIKNAIAEIFSVKSLGNQGHYSYASKNQIEYDYNSSKDYKRIEKKGLEIIEQIKDKYITICKEFETIGYNAYSQLYTEEYAKDTCEANDFTFLSDGTLFDE